MNKNIKPLLVVVLCFIAISAFLVRLFQPDPDLTHPNLTHEEVVSNTPLSSFTSNAQKPFNIKTPLNANISPDVLLPNHIQHKPDTESAKNKETLNKRDPYYRENALVTVVSMETLRLFLDTMTVSNFESTSASIFLEQSEEGVQLVIDEFITEADPDRRALFLDLLTTTSTSEKIPLAENLIGSSEVQERRAAYAWLAGEENHASAHLMLIDASYYEQDLTALNELITSISTVSDDEDTFDIAVDRLNELTFHHEQSVAKQALSILTGLTQDEQTLNTLHTHIDGNDEPLKRAAMQGLAFFQQVDSKTYDKIVAIAQTQSESEETRLLAEELIKAWGVNP